MSKSSREIQPGQSVASVVFEFPCVLPSMNEIVKAAKGCGGTGVMYSRMKEMYTLLIMAMARAQYKGAPFDSYRLGFRWFLKNAKKDPDNIIAAKKFILDGMVAAKVLANDTQKNFLGIIGETWEIRAKKPGVEVTVEAAP